MNLWYNPLYFEDAPLERYGHTYHHALQPFASVAKFGKQLIGLRVRQGCSRPHGLRE